MVKIAGSFAVLLLVCGLAPAQTGSSSGAAGKPAAGAQVAIQDWRGILMDASCATSGAASATPAASETSAKSDSTSVDSGRPEKGHKKHHAEAQSCPVSASTSAFALKTEGGQVMKFDAVGNARAAEELKAKPAWTKDLSAGKPIHAKVSGTLNGETITVTSIG